MVETIVDPYETGRNACDDKRMNQVNRIGRVSQETARGSSEIEVSLEKLQDHQRHVETKEARHEIKGYFEYKTFGQVRSKG
jgi:hypothetical protein